MAEAALKARNVSRDQLIAELRALKGEFMRAGVTHMTLFGSRARQDNRPDSDVDIAIEVDPSRKFSLVELSRVGFIVEDTTGLTANVFMRRSLRPSILASILRDGEAVF